MWLTQLSCAGPYGRGEVGGCPWWRSEEGRESDTKTVAQRSTVGAEDQGGRPLLITVGDGVLHVRVSTDRQRSDGPFAGAYRTRSTRHSIGADRTRSAGTIVDESDPNGQQQVARAPLRQADLTQELRNRRSDRRTWIGCERRLRCPQGVTEIPAQS